MKQPYKTVELKTVKLKSAKNAQPAPKANEREDADKMCKPSTVAAKTAPHVKAIKKPKRKEPTPKCEKKDVSQPRQWEEALSVRETGFEEKIISEPELVTEENIVPVPGPRRKDKPDNKPDNKPEDVSKPQIESQEGTVCDTDDNTVKLPQFGLDESALSALESDLDGVAVPAKQPRPRRAHRRMPVWLMVAIDVLVAACVLVVFSYYHHGRPQADTTEAIVIARPTTTPAPAAPKSTDLNDGDDEEGLPENAEPTWAQKFAAHFTDTVVVTDTSYSSPNVSITITPMTRGEGRGLVTYYVADIYVADIESFQTYFAKETYGTGFRQHVLDMDIASGALLAMSGDYYGNSRSSSHGVVIRNGMLYRADDTRSEVCVLYYDGTMETYQRGEFDAEQAFVRGAWQAWTFGPSLLDENGKAKTEFNIGSVLQSENPRGGIGYYEPGHYVFVLVDGRDKGYSAGVTMDDFALIFEELGCSVAYNLDGGASAVLSYNDQVVNQPVGGGRTISDCLIIVEVEK